MQGRRFRIGVIAPASRLEEDTGAQVQALAASLCGGDVPEIVFHPQCFLSSGHFAGPDSARAKAFLEIANDESFDALWFGRGGYGSNRIVAEVIPKLSPAARNKTYLGYSDTGFLLAALYKAGFAHVAHGPVVNDIKRDGGDAAFARGLRWLTARDATALEPSLSGDAPAIALNLKIATSLIGTDFLPDLVGHVLMLEDTAEHHYAIDRMMWQLTSYTPMKKLAGIRLGRCSAIPENDPPFEQSDEDIVRHWCTMSGISYLGRADIGHDIENKIVPFGPLRV
jgi:muramoyltetrapeptide carboxypeptidase